jgi:hypothetical protein
MKTEEEVKPEIQRLYSELGKDPEELMVRIKDYTYHIIRSDGAETEISRKDIDDYFGSAPGKIIAKERIKEALKTFRLHE